MKRPFNAIQLTPNGKHCKHRKILSLHELTTVRKWIRWKNVPAREILSVLRLAPFIYNVSDFRLLI